MRLKERLKLFWALLFRGMKSADDTITASNKEIEAGGPAIEEKVQEDNLFAQLLRGEVTQEVKDLRYEMYESVRKSEDFKVMGFSGKAIKKNSMLSSAPEHIDTEDGLKVVLVQDNMMMIDGLSNSMKDLSHAAAASKELDVEHLFKIQHKGFVRYKIERLARKVVVKKLNDSADFKLDFYLSELPIENEPRAIFATKELKMLYETGARSSDFLDITTLTFQTYKAFGDKDWMIYDFTVKDYLGIKKYDGCYILSFSASLPSGSQDAVADYYDEVAKEKFEKKTPRKKKGTISINDAVDLQDNEKNAIDEEKANELVGKIKKKKEE